MEIGELVGLTINSILGLDKESERVVISTNRGDFALYHIQDCCEHVRLNDFEIDANLSGAIITGAEFTESDASQDV